MILLMSGGLTIIASAVVFLIVTIILVGTLKQNWFLQEMLS